MKMAESLVRLRTHLKSKMVQNTYLILAMRLMGTFSGFVFWAVVANIIQPTEMGVASAIVAASALMARLAQLGLGYSLVRFMPHHDQPVQLINLALWVTGGLAIAVGAVFLIGVKLWSPALMVLRSDWLIAIMFVLLAAGTAISSLLYWIFLARQLPVYALGKNMVQVVLSLLLIPLLWLYAAGFRTVLTIYLFSTLFSLWVALFLLLPRSEPGYRFSWFQPKSWNIQLTRFSLASYATDLMQNVPTSLLTLLVVNLLGSNSAAYFFVVWAIASGLSGLVGSVSASYFAEAANTPENATVQARQAIRLGLALALSIALGITIFSRMILSFYGDLYVQNASLLLVLMSLSIIPELMFAILMNLLRIQVRNGALLLMTGVNLFLGISLSTAGMLLGDITGLGVGWLVSKLIVMLLSYAVVLRKRNSSKSFQLSTDLGK